MGPILDPLRRSGASLPLEVVMSKRHKMNRRKSERYFSKTAGSVHKKNMLHSAGPMRGGIRL